MMKPKIKTALLVTLAFVAFPRPASAESVTSILSTCSGDRSYVEMSECVKDKADNSESELKRSEDSVINRLSRREEEPEDIKRAEDTFWSSEKAFQVYRKKTCDFYAATVFGGNGAHDLRAACVAMLNGQHAEQLWEMAARIGE